MTQVKLIYDNNIVIGFRLEGHAGYASKGPDILCASISTATQMIINGILDWTGLDEEETIKEYDEEKAILHFELPSMLHASVTAQQLFKTFELYMELLDEQYSGYIKLERREEK